MSGNLLAGIGLVYSSPLGQNSQIYVFSSWFSSSASLLSQLELESCIMLSLSQSLSIVPCLAQLELELCIPFLPAGIGNDYPLSQTGLEVCILGLSTEIGLVHQFSFSWSWNSISFPHELVRIVYTCSLIWLWSRAARVLSAGF